jgi:hypothetical protein
MIVGLFFIKNSHGNPHFYRNSKAEMKIVKTDFPGN